MLEMHRLLVVFDSLVKVGVRSAYTLPSPYPRLAGFELCLVEYEALNYKPSMRCASVIYVARCTMQITPAWTPLLGVHATQKVCGNDVTVSQSCNNSPSYSIRAPATAKLHQ